MIQTELNFRGVQETSRIAYHENKEGKKRQAEEMVEWVRRGKDNLKDISDCMGLEQGRISARMSDCLKAELLAYDGVIRRFDGDLPRKRIVLGPKA